MWADQVSSSDGASAHRKSAIVTGFEVEAAPEDGPTETRDETTDAPQLGTEEVAQDPFADSEATAVPEEVIAEESNAPVAFPASSDKELPAERSVTSAEQDPDVPQPPSASAPVAFPSAEVSAPVAFPSDSADNAAAPVAFPSSSSSPAPLAFPTSVDTSSQREGSVAERGPGVTFQDAQTPERTGTPDPEATDGKRRRTLSTQGIQRLARRISITTRRQGSATNIPSVSIPSIPAIAGSISAALKRQDTTRSSTDEGSVRDGAVPSNLRDSPSASVSSELGGKPKGSKIKKEKKDKRKSMPPPS